MVPVATPWGMLIYLRSSVNVAKEVRLPNILTISAEELLTCLRDASFGDLVRRLRNQRVHGNP